MTRETSDIHQWQQDVHAFHVAMGLKAGDYANPAKLEGETLKLRIHLLNEEANELEEAARGLDVVEVVDALIDIAYIVLGTFDTCGVVCRTRFGLLTSTGIYRGFDWFNEPIGRGIRSVLFTCGQALFFMRQHEDQQSSFERWDLLESVMQEIAHCFCALGLDPRPAFDAIHANNLSKAGGPIDENGKLCKPPGFRPVDLCAVLQRQGLADYWRER